MWHIVTHHGELIETTENLRDVNRLDPSGVIYGHYLKDKLKEFSNDTHIHDTKQYLCPGTTGKLYRCQQKKTESYWGRCR